MSTSREFFADPVAVARASPCPALRLQAPTGDAVLIREPDEIWRVLVTDAASFRQGKWKQRARRFVGSTLNTLDGPAHRDRRLMLQPALERRRVARFEDTAAVRAAATIARWPRDRPVPLRSLLDPLSLSIAGEILLGVDVEPVAESLADDLATIMSGLARFTPPLPGTRAGRALRRVHRQVDGLLATRAATAEPPDDLATILLASGLDHETTIGELTAFLLAAADEPPSGLAAIYYLLALEPETEARLATTPDDGALLDAVVAEALRLLPPARHLDRMPLGPTTVAGLAVDARTNLLVSPTVTHRDETVFPHPDRFDSDRWLATPRTARSGYLPFGAGAHSCIGEHLARLVMTTVLAETTRTLRVELEPGSEPPIPGRRPLVVTLRDR